MRFLSSPHTGMDEMICATHGCKYVVVLYITNYVAEKPIPITTPKQKIEDLKGEINKERKKATKKKPKRQKERQKERMPLIPNKIKYLEFLNLFSPCTQVK